MSDVVNSNTDSTALYEGRTTHRRMTPRRHRFAFGLWMALLDADHPDGPDGAFTPAGAARLRLAGRPTFRREDYLDGSNRHSLGDAVRDLVEVRTGRRPAGPVRTLTQVRSGGYVFNPITVHWCLSERGGDVEVIVLEVTNTPWKERHCYVLDARQGAEGQHVLTRDAHGRFTATFPKELHVSPFMAMDQTYRFRATAPGDHLWLALENWQRGDRILRAELNLRRRPATVDALRSLASAHRGQTRRVWAGIHLHALALAAKRVPFQRHPGRAA